MGILQASNVLVLFRNEKCCQCFGKITSDYRQHEGSFCFDKIIPACRMYSHYALPAAFLLFCVATVRNRGICCFSQIFLQANWPDSRGGRQHPEQKCVNFIITVHVRERRQTLNKSHLLSSYWHTWGEYLHLTVVSLCPTAAEGVSSLTQCLFYSNILSVCCYSAEAEQTPTSNLVLMSRWMVPCTHRVGEVYSLYDAALRTAGFERAKTGDQLGVFIVVTGWSQGERFHTQAGGCGV